MKGSEETISSHESEKDKSPVSLTEIRYGDIIRIDAPENKKWDQKSFFVHRMTPTQIQLIDIDPAHLSPDQPPDIYRIVIEQGVLHDGTISGFDLLARRESLGYAAQNELTPGKRIVVEWSDTASAPLQGMIMAADKDGIDVQETETSETYYFDFAYQGLPDEIADIRIVGSRPSAEPNPPVGIPETSAEAVGQEDIDPLEEALVEGDKTLHDYLSPMDFEQDDLDVVVQVEVPQERRRYTVDAQLQDIVANFQSKMQAHMMTPVKERELERIKDRFLELRLQTTRFEANGVAVPTKPDTKPLATLFAASGKSSHPCKDVYSWLRPVVHASRNIFLEGNSDFEFTLDPRSDAILVPHNTAAPVAEAWDHYKANQETGTESKYKRMVRGSMELPPYSMAGGAGFRQPVSCPQHVLLSNLPNDNLLSTSYHRAAISFRRSLQARFVDAFQASKMKDPAIVPAEVLTIRSFYLGPTAAIEASRPFLPSTPLAQRIVLQQGLRGIPVFNKPERLMLTKLDPLCGPFNESAKAKATCAAKKQGKVDAYEGVPAFGSRPLHVFPPDSEARNQGTLHETLQTLLPDTEYFLNHVASFSKERLQIPTTFGHLLQQVEPLAVYQQNVGYGTYRTMTNLVSRNVRLLMNQILTNKKEFRALIQPLVRYFRQTQMNHLNKLFSSPANPDRRLTRSLEEVYRRPFQTHPVGMSELLPSTPTDAELLLHFQRMDHSQVLALAVQVLHLPDTLPENMYVPPIMDELEDGKTAAKFKKAGNRRLELSDKVLAKIYSSEDDIRRDNGDDKTVYYDEGRDVETPYKEIELLQNEKGKTATTEEEKLEFLTQALSAKYDIREDAEAREQAEAVLNQKRKVKDGDYAALRQVRVVVAEDDETLRKKKHEIEDFRIYKRVKGIWRWEANRTMDEFADTKSLLARVKQGENQATKELNRRFELSKEELRAILDDQFQEAQRRVRRRETLQRHMELKQNDLLWGLSHINADTGSSASPYMPLRDDILAIHDVPTRQFAVLQFYQLYCREALSEENPRWAYCRETNLPLLPIAFYELARAFQQGHEVYNNRIGQVCRIYGTMDESGAYWVDKESRLILTSIELVDEGWEQPDLFQDDANEESEAAIRLQASLDDLFEDKEVARGTTTIANAYTGTAQPVNERIVQARKVFSFFVEQTGVRPDASLKQSWQRIVDKLMASTTLFPSRDKYDAKRRTQPEDMVIQKPPYDLFIDRNTVFATMAAFFFAVQTRIPDVQRSGQRAGPLECHYSFDGFPVHSEDPSDDVGLKYMACILFANRSDERPWNATRKLKLQQSTDELKRTIQTILSQPLLADQLDAKRRYYAKRQQKAGSPVQANTAPTPLQRMVSAAQSLLPKSTAYAAPSLLGRSASAIGSSASAEGNIPSVRPSPKRLRTGWQHFLPPVVEFSVANKITIEKEAIPGLFREFENNVRTTLTRSGQKRHVLLSLLSWVSTLTYAFVEKMNQVVRGQQVRLLTQNQIPFLENTCCDEKAGIEKVLSFFAAKEPTLTKYIAMVSELDKGLAVIQQVMQGSLLYYVRRPAFPLDIEMRVSPPQNVFLAYIYYLYDRNLYDDPEIRAVIQVAAPTLEYRACITAQDKVKFFEKANPDIGSGQPLFQQIMRIIHLRGTIAWQPPTSWEQRELTVLTQFQEKLETWIEAETDPFLPKKLLQFLGTQPTSAPVEKALAASLELKADRLRQALAQLGFVQPVVPWSLGVDKSVVVQYYSNAIYSLLYLYPGMVIHKKQARVPLFGPNSGGKTKGLHVFEHGYWGFSKTHEALLQEKEAAFFRPFAPLVDDADLVDFLRHFMDQTRLLADIWSTIPVHLFSVATLQSLWNCMQLDIYFKYFEMADQYEARQTVATTTSGLEAGDLAGRVFSNEEEEMETVETLNRESAALENRRNVAWKGKLREFLRLCSTEEKARRQEVDVSYQEAEETVRLQAYQEKMGVIQRFNQMKDDERRVEKIMKKFKLGKWNLGMSKNVFRYSKNQFDEEVQDETLFHMMPLLHEGADDQEALPPTEGEEGIDEEGNDVAYDYEAEDDEEGNGLEYDE